MKDLTARQQAILDFIRETIIGNQRPPTIREIMERFGLASTNGVVRHLDRLEEKGKIARDSNRANGIRLTGVRVVLEDVT